MCNYIRYKYIIYGIQQSCRTPNNEEKKLNSYKGLAAYVPKPTHGQMGACDSRTGPPLLVTFSARQQSPTRLALAA